MSPSDALVHLLEEIERAGTTPMDLVRAGRRAEPWTLYPDEYGVFDRATRNQFYFHAHEGAPHEAGHFHTVRFSPTRTVHLVAISMTEYGWPQALFTVNLWAIGDAHVPQDRLKHYVRTFHIDERRGNRRLIRFVNLMFTVFRPEIEALQEEKARAIAVHRLTHPDVNPFEDRSLEVLSRIAIDLRDDALSRRHT